MDEDAKEALEYYQSRRFDDQRTWYARRSDEFDRAQRQAGFCSAVFLVLSAFAAALGTADIGGQRRGWAIAAAVAAALSAAIASYAATYQFDTLARTYNRAVDALGLLAPDLPGLDGADGDVGEYVGRAETILLGEVERWGKSTDGVGTQEIDSSAVTATNPVGADSPASSTDGADELTSPAGPSEGQESGGPESSG
jgi:hypothetical protein